MKERSYFCVCSAELFTKTHVKVSPKQIAFFSELALYMENSIGVAIQCSSLSTADAVVLPLRASSLNDLPHRLKPCLRCCHGYGLEKGHIRSAPSGHCNIL